MLYGAEVAVCSDINIKEMNRVWGECQFLSYEPDGPCNQMALKG